MDDTASIRWRSDDICSDSQPFVVPGPSGPSVSPLGKQWLQMATVEGSCIDSAPPTPLLARQGGEQDNANVRYDRGPLDTTRLLNAKTREKQPV